MIYTKECKAPVVITESNQHYILGVDLSMEMAWRRLLTFKTRFINLNVRFFYSSYDYFSMCQILQIDTME